MIQRFQGRKSSMKHFRVESTLLYIQFVPHNTFRWYILLSQKVKQNQRLFNVPNHKTKKWIKITIWISWASQHKELPLTVYSMLLCLTHQSLHILSSTQASCLFPLLHPCYHLPNPGICCISPALPQQHLNFSHLYYRLSLKCCYKRKWRKKFKNQL